MWELKTIDEVKKILSREIKLAPIETVEVIRALDRIVADDIVSPEDLPPFTKSMMDGFALRAADTFGATEENPVQLDVIGEVLIGQVPTVPVKEGQALKIGTGAMMPGGADSVEMIEYTEALDNGRIEVRQALTPGENVFPKGTDIKKGDTLISCGHRLRAQDIGALCALGITKVRVFRRPKVAIVSTGDELVKPEVEPKLGQIRDMNSYSLAAQIQKAGGEPIFLGIVKDDYQLLLSKAQEAISLADIVLISGGSSVGTYDLTLKVLEALSKGKVLVHGIAQKPGKPTIIAKADEKILFGLPGNPVSVMVSFNELVRPVILRMMSAKEERRMVEARLARTIASSTGREEFIRVRLEEKEGGLLAVPLPRGAANITSLIRADGIIRVPGLSEGMAKGQPVEVELWD